MADREMPSPKRERQEIRIDLLKEIKVNGVDISESCLGFTLSQFGGGLAVLQIEMLPKTLDSLKIAGLAEIRIESGTTRHFE